MDERRDPGEFYPGGRVIAREGVAPGQVSVRWRDIIGKPDFSDVATLDEEATRGEMKQTMNTVINKLKTSLLIGTLFAIGAALADVEPRFAKADDIPGNQQVMTNTQEYVDAKVASIASATNDLPTRAEIEAGCFPATRVSSPWGSSHYESAFELCWQQTVSGTNRQVYSSAQAHGVAAQVGSTYLHYFLMSPLMPGRLVRQIYSGGSFSEYDYDFPLKSGTVALASDIPDVSAKQDRLPYPTNAIPHSAIVGVPSETDPTVPAWAKEDNKPDYSMEEIIDHDYIPASWIMNAPWLGRNGGTMTGSITFNTANTGIRFYHGSTSYSNDSYSFFGPGTFLIIMPECLRLWNDHDGTNYWDGCYYETLPEHLDRVVPAVSASTTSNVVTKAYVESLGIASGGIEDPVRHCTWVQCVTNGVFYWIVQEEP